MIRVTRDKHHDIFKDGVYIGQIYLARAERTRQSGPHGQAVCPTPPLYGAASAGGERQAPPPGVNYAMDFL